jgi:hypothetical protein
MHTPKKHTKMLPLHGMGVRAPNLLGWSRPHMSKHPPFTSQVPDQIPVNLWLNLLSLSRSPQRSLAQANEILYTLCPCSLRTTMMGPSKPSYWLLLLFISGAIRLQSQRSNGHKLYVFECEHFATTFWRYYVWCTTRFTLRSAQE